ncbi:TolC family protein [Fibrobacter succinogenes]|uniref:Outer membrane protein TolC n=1 Tax=Fibrobacter succinogenes TaxID=833 RepID=A0A380S5X8_FIBSU|nr:TolC family protein [Fibrobacter succinogenes]PWJ35493.1 outer membrane protein TolC [Fibrobacter succinogenes subsp. elongatus]SUQ24148.1 Outer membrane protein TolC [Fibrobacter succinogenes]
MKRYFAFILSGCVAANATALSLQDALDMAMANNSKIKAEKAKVDIAQSGEDEAFARFLPTVSLSAGITKINDPINIDLGRLSDVAGAAAYSKAYIDAYNKASAGYKQAYEGAYAKTGNEAQAKAYAENALKEKLGTGSPETFAQQTAEKYGSAAENADFNMKVQDDWFFNARLSVVWPIFTGLKIYSAYDAAKENVNARKAEFEMAQNTVLMDVATKYFTLRLCEELVGMRETTKKDLEEHLNRSKKLEEGGQISKTERLRAEVALAEAENAYEDALRDQSLARMALASLLHTDTSLTATTPVESPEGIRSMDEFKALAVEKHPGLRQLRIERKRNQNAIRAARADYFPTVALFGYKELYTRDLTILEPEWAIGAKMQWDIFKGGDTRAKVSSAKAMDRSLGSLEEETIDNLKLLVEKRWRELEHAKGRLASLVKTRELAVEALRSQNKAYEAGLATGLEVVDAELALSRLQVADIKAHYDAVIAWLGLLEAAGEVSTAGTVLVSKQLVVEKPVATESAQPVEQNLETENK